MPNVNAARGQRWEKAIFDYLREWFGRNVVRPQQEGYVDIGDLHLSPWVIQAKDEARHTFSSYVDDAEKQAKAAGELYAAAVVKRRNKGVDRAYVVTSLGTFRKFTSRLRRAEELLLRANPDLFDKHMDLTKKENEAP